MLTSALGNMFYGSGDVSESSHPLTRGRRITLAVVALLHTENDPMPARTILFRLHIDEMEGRSAEPVPVSAARPV